MNNLIRISEKEVVFRVACRHAPVPLDLPLTACIDPIIKIVDGHDTLEGINIIYYVMMIPMQFICGALAILLHMGLL